MRRVSWLVALALAGGVCSAAETNMVVRVHTVNPVAFSRTMVMASESGDGEDGGSFIAIG